MNIDKARDIKGWMSDPELEFLAIMANRSEITIEFGCYQGRSTRAMADNTHGIILAVDPWNGVYFNNNNERADYIEADSFDKFFRNLEEHIRAERVIPYKLYSWEFPQRGSEIADFIFIDGDHRYTEVKRDIDIARHLVRRGGVIAGHDYGRTDWPGVAQAVDEVFPMVNKVDTIWWTQRF